VADGNVRLALTVATWTMALPICLFGLYNLLQVGFRYEAMAKRSVLAGQAEGEGGRSSGLLLSGLLALTSCEKVKIYAIYACGLLSAELMTTSVTALIIDVGPGS
jgi:hypothetical protein